MAHCRAWMFGCKVVEPLNDADSRSRPTLSLCFILPCLGLPLVLPQDLVGPGASALQVACPFAILGWGNEPGHGVHILEFGQFLPSRLRSLCTSWWMGAYRLHPSWQFLRVGTHTHPLSPSLRSAYELKRTRPFVSKPHKPPITVHHNG
ncbi:hypothetical protein LX36DRAFT_157635 [Colletotrichum falcatum]|nr:hypothetical protein LX36DRAFT_157635 [Colletotrichum falcatum]